jgi:MFS family permease
LILRLTDSPFYLGAAGMCQGVARIAFSLLGGAVVDRVNRKSLFHLTIAASTLTTLILSLLIFIGKIHVWHLLASSVLTGVLMSFEQPVRQAILYNLVPEQELLGAVSLYEMVYTVSGVIGPAIGGLMIPQVGEAGCYFLNGASFMAVTATIFLMDFPEFPRSPKSKGIAADMLSGLRYVWTHPLLLPVLTLLAVLSLFGRSYSDLMPVFARDILRVGAPGLGFLHTAGGIGAIVASSALASLSDRDWWRRMFFTAFLSHGVILIVFSRSVSFPFSVVCAAVLGAFHSIALISISAILQVTAESASRGRVMAMYGMLNRGLTPLASFPAGALAAWLGTKIAVSLNGVALLIGVLSVLLLQRGIRRIRF